MSAAPADLRAATLSDLRHPSATGTGRLALLLPDVPGEPFGGTATPAQRQATAEATGQPVPAFLFPGKATRPHDLRALLRSWAASQPRSTSLREQIADLLQDNIPGFYPDHLRAADALLERYAVASRGKDNATGLRSTIQALSRLDAQGNPATLP